VDGFLRRLHLAFKTSSLKSAAVSTESLASLSGVDFAGEGIKPVPCGTPVCALDATRGLAAGGEAVKQVTTGA